MNEFVPFYGSLCRGAKRGLSRATRFIYLELSLEAREFEGVIALPRGFRSDADAVHDIIGGNRKEIGQALTDLTSVLESRSERDPPMITISGPSHARIITINAHARWVRPDKSAGRMRRFRQRQTEENRAVSVHSDASRDVTVTANSDGGDASRDVTVTATKERRGEEKKEETPIPPLGDGGQSVLKLEAETHHSAPIHEVFDFWAERRAKVTGGSSKALKLSSGRAAKIKGRLGEGYTVEQLKRAVIGIFSNKFNIDGGHTDIELVCRDAAHVDRYIECAPYQRPSGPRLVEQNAPATVPEEPPAPEVATVDIEALITATVGRHEEALKKIYYQPTLAEQLAEAKKVFG